MLKSMKLLKRNWLISFKVQNNFRGSTKVDLHEILLMDFLRGKPLDGC